MTLKELIDSGSTVFKRPRHEIFITINDQGMLEWDHVETQLLMTAESLVAEDWEDLDFYINKQLGATNEQ